MLVADTSAGTEAATAVATAVATEMDLPLPPPRPTAANVELPLPPPRPIAANMDLPMPPPRPTAAAAIAVKFHVTPHQALPATARLSQASAPSADSPGHDSPSAGSPDADSPGAESPDAHSPVPDEHDGSLAAIWLAYNFPASSSDSRCTLSADSKAADAPLPPEPLHAVGPPPLPPKPLHAVGAPTFPPKALQVAQQEAQRLTDSLSRRTQTPKPAQTPGQTPAARTGHAQASRQTPPVRRLSRFGPHPKPGPNTGDPSRAPAQLTIPDHVMHTAAAVTPARLPNNLAAASFPHSMQLATPCAALYHAARSISAAVLSPTATAVPSVAAVVPDPTAAADAATPALESALRHSKGGNVKQNTSSGVHGQGTALPPPPPTAATSPATAVVPVTPKFEEGQSTPAKLAAVAATRQTCRQDVRYSSSPLGKPGSPCLYTTPIPDPQPSKHRGSGEAFFHSQGEIRYKDSYSLSRGRHYRSATHHHRKRSHSASRRRLRTHRRRPHSLSPDRSRALSQDAHGYRRRHRRSCHLSPSTRTSLSPINDRHRHAHGLSSATGGISPRLPVRQSAGENHQRQQDSTSAALSHDSPLLGSRQPHRRSHGRHMSHGRSMSPMPSMSHGRSMSHDRSMSHGRSMSRGRSMSHGRSMSPSRGTSGCRQQPRRSRSRSRADVSARDSKHRHSRLKDNKHTHKLKKHSRKHSKHSKHRRSSSQTTRASPYEAARGYGPRGHRRRHRHRRRGGSSPERCADRSDMGEERKRALPPVWPQINTRAAGE